ncbi:NADH-quinone oxidoreductase subunit A [Streptomyces echinatus]|uniref:NADH-quinone oxidoreductase subunit A n=1 Tax=Streptomyces echinatus TaxID=67293 RepID=UPI003CD05E29
MAHADRPKRYNRAKLEAYECGIEPTPHAGRGGRFPIKYYLTAMLFIVFASRSSSPLPLGRHFDACGIFGLVIAALRAHAVFVAYAYVWLAAAWNGTEGL